MAVLLENSSHLQIIEVDNEMFQMNGPMGIGMPVSVLVSTRLLLLSAPL